MCSVLLIILAGLAAFLVFVATRPDTFKVERKVAIAAPASAIFPHVNELQKWGAWSPWAKLDINAKHSFEGPVVGTGAAMRWAGNNKVGEGTMTITESHPNEKIAFRLDFLKPFAATNTAEFTFVPDGSQTMVSWSMSGKSTFISKLMGVFMNCDKMVGEQFDKGLADLKKVAEGSK
jgi:hypothetical protein